MRNRKYEEERGKRLERVLKEKKGREKGKFSKKEKDWERKQEKKRYFV